MSICIRFQDLLLTRLHNGTRWWFVFRYLFFVKYTGSKEFYVLRPIVTSFVMVQYSDSEDPCVLFSLNSTNRTREGARMPSRKCSSGTKPKKREPVPYLFFHAHNLNDLLLHEHHHLVLAAKEKGWCNNSITKEPYNATPMVWRTRTTKTRNTKIDLCMPIVEN